MSLNSQTPDARPEDKPAFSLVRDRYRSFLSRDFDILQILRDSLQLLREGWRDLAFIFVALQIPLIIVSLLILPSEPEVVAGPEAASRYFPTLMFLYFIGLFITVNVLTASRYIVMGAPKQLHEIFKHAVVKFPIAVLAAFAVWAVVMLVMFPAFAATAIGGGVVGVIFFFIMLIPVIVVTVYASLFLHSIALGDRGVLGALIHTFSLVRGNWWRTFSVYLVIAALILPVGLPLKFFTELFNSPLGVKLAVDIIVGVLGLFSIIPTVILYYNLIGIHSESPGAADEASVPGSTGEHDQS